MAAVMEVEMQTRLGVGRVAAEVALANDDLVRARGSEVRALLHEQYLPLAGYALPFLWVAARVVAAVRARPHAVPRGRRRRGRGVRARATARCSSACRTGRRTRVGGALRGRARRGGQGSRRRRCRAPTSAAWRAAVEAAAAPEAPGFLVAYALLRQAEAELAGADRTAARASLQAALDVADSGGVLAPCATASLRVAIGRRPRARGRGRRRRPRPHAGIGVAGAPSDADVLAAAELTARERQVLELIAEGLSNRQIGERLFISGKTASVHVSAILRKLGAATRTEAAYRAGALR